MWIISLLNCNCLKIFKYYKGLCTLNFYVWPFYFQSDTSKVYLPCTPSLMTTLISSTKSNTSLINLLSSPAMIRNFFSESTAKTITLSVFPSRQPLSSVRSQGSQFIVAKAKLYRNSNKKFTHYYLHATSKLRRIPGRTQSYKSLEETISNPFLNFQT